MRYPRTIVAVIIFLAAMSVPLIGDMRLSGVETLIMVATLLIAMIAFSGPPLLCRGPAMPGWLGATGFIRRVWYVLATGARDVGDAARMGWLAFSGPKVMRQGVKRRVEVAITRDPRPSESMSVRMYAVGEVSVESILTSAVMEVDLIGVAFEITPLSSRRQLIESTAYWEFDVRPRSSGQQDLTVVGTRWVNTRGGAAEPVALPALKRTVHVRASVPYLAGTLVRAHWQWIAGTVLGLGGAIGAWITLLRG